MPPGHPASVFPGLAATDTSTVGRGGTPGSAERQDKEQTPPVPAPRHAVPHNCPLDTAVPQGGGSSQNNSSHQGRLFFPKSAQTACGPRQGPAPAAHRQFGLSSSCLAPSGNPASHKQIRELCPSLGLGGSSGTQKHDRRHGLLVTSSAPRQAACPCGIKGSTQDSPIRLCQGLKLEINGKSPERVGFPTRRDEDFYGLSPRALIKH